MEKSSSKGWRAEADGRIVGEAKSFFGNSKHVLVELHVSVFIVECDDTVIARGDVFEFNCGISFAIGNRGRIVPKRLRDVLGPSRRRCEEHYTNDALCVAQTVRTNTQNTSVRRGLDHGGWTGVQLGSNR